MKKNSPNSEANIIFSQNLCVSCGVCNIRQNTKFEFDNFGYLLPENKEELDLSNCPITHQYNEDDISQEKFQGKIYHDPSIGYYDQIHAARIQDLNLLKKRSSGGIITFVLKSLLERKEVDAVATVFNYTSEPYFRYKLCENADELNHASTSVYYPVEIGTVLSEAKKKNLRIAVTGLPCCIKGVNHLMQNDDRIRELVKFQISLICGHLKTSKYLEILSNQLPHIEQPSFNFRGHDQHAAAKVKYFEKHNTKELKSKQTSSLYAGSYNYGYFQYEGCNYCDDIIGETADLSVGDAWLPEYVDKTQGMSLCISRHKKISEVLNSRALEKANLLPKDVVSAQQGGYRQRREGLAYRIKRYPKIGVTKRTHLLPNFISKKREAIYEARYQLSKLSHIQYQSSRSIDEFKARMDNFFKNLQKKTSSSFLERLVNKVYRELRKVKLRAK